MIEARILPPNEWNRLERTQIPMLPGVPAEDIDVVVVEDGDKVIACLSVLRVTHFEGLWIDPERRSKGLGVPTALLRLALALAGERGNEWVWAGAANGDDRMHSILGRMGTLLPLESYVLNLGGAECRRPS